MNTPPLPATWRTPLLGLLATLVVLSGCATTMPERSAPIQLPAQFSAADHTQDAGPGAERQAQWWTALGDPALDGLVGAALEGSFTLGMAWDRLAQSDALVRRARAGLFPTLDGQASAGYTADSERPDAASFLLGLSASWELDLWGRVRSTRDAAAFDALALTEAVRAAALSLSASVARTWYSVVEARGQLALLESQLEINRQILEVVGLRFGRGQAVASDVLRQRQLVESVLGEQARARSTLGVAEHQLALLVGRAPGTLEIPGTTSLPDPPALPDAGIPADLVQRRPDVLQAMRQVQAADSRVAVALAERFPRLSLSASGSTQSASITGLFTGWLANLAANLLAPIFDGGSRRAEVVRARAAASEAVGAWGQAMLVALTEVEDALLQEAEQRRYLTSLDAQVELGRLATERARESYSLGRSDYLSVLDALSTWQALQRTHLGARADLLRFRIDLSSALAGAWELERPVGDAGERAQRRAADEEDGNL